ncbi:unnamed protein product [Cuscuta epithymum]|uniref:Uncharacterized protein n=1 Tax=Cuscuta epithymum TaxID=186058 RepID=A0AAV0F2S1_9ASTE|nr:unnamed protein product [Cuscuta epithymum]
MAGALRTSACLLPLTPFAAKHLSPTSSLSSLDHRKVTRRKNKLRPKILKTLTKPYTNPPLPIELPHTNPVIPIESPPEEIHTLRSDEASSEYSTVPEMQEADVSETIREVQASEIPKPRVLNHRKIPVLNILLWSAAAVIVRYIYVSILGSAKDGETGEKDETLEMGTNDNTNNNIESKLNLFLAANDDIGGVERKIEEIRVMARRVRAKEKVEAAKRSSLSDDKGVGDSFVSNAIGKEVENRLMSLHMPLERDDYPRRNSEKQDMNGAMLFKKKNRFRDSSSKPGYKPKGFMGKSKSDGEEQEKGDAFIGAGKVSLEERKDIANSNHGSGVVQDGSNQEIKVISNKMERSKTSFSSKRREVTDKLQTKKSGGIKSEKETDFWWLSLPYILIIQMHGSLGGERPQEPFFSIKSCSGDVSHVVAFEDHIDATNFCYILQSHYDHLEDFDSEIVVVTINEQRVKSGMENVIVVRKGQLKLYAGQPLADVEMALHKLSGQS